MCTYFCWAQFFPFVQLGAPSAGFEDAIRLCHRWA
jgi:hypothetical protein